MYSAFLLGNQLLVPCSDFEIQVLSTSAIKCRGSFRIFQFASAIRRQKNPPKIQQKALYISSAMAFSIHQHFVKGYNLDFLTIELLVLKKLYCLRITLELVKRKTIILSLITLFWFLCVSLL